MAHSSDDRSARFLRHLEPLQAALEAYCRRSVHDSNFAEDVLQEAVGKAFRDFHRYAEGTNFRAWIFRYLNLEIYAGSRSFHRQRLESLVVEPTIEEVWQQSIDEPLVERLLEKSEHVLDQCDDALAEAIADLSPLERSVLLLRAIGQFKHREMAEILEVPMGTVMSALSRGRIRLRQQLADYADEFGLLERDSMHRPR